MQRARGGNWQIIIVLAALNIVIMAALTALSPTFLTYGNLSAVMLRMSELAMLASQFVELVGKDKEARKKRDEQYEEGIRRTGLGDDAPGGAEFQGASKVVHPMLTEACVDWELIRRSRILHIAAAFTATTGYATAVAASRAANVSGSRQSPRSVGSRRRNTQISPPSISTSRLPRSTTSRSPTPGRCSRCRKQGS